MEKSRKIMNLIALTVFLGSNFLTPISYAIDDLEAMPQSESNSESQVWTDVSVGGGGLSY